MDPNWDWYFDPNYTSFAPISMKSGYAIFRTSQCTVPSISQANPSNALQPNLYVVAAQTPLTATSLVSDVRPTGVKATSRGRGKYRRKRRRNLTDEERTDMCLDEAKREMTIDQIAAKYDVERR